VDTDVGQSAASAQHREGFNTLVGQVTLGQVSMILSYDVTRLSRNCSDWYPLLDLCGYKGCLIADVDGLYDPSTANGRLLLGFKTPSLYNTSFTCCLLAAPSAAPASHDSAEYSGQYGN
jgi:DNA invertase Pin-like site-specific DNA recombinase